MTKHFKTRHRLDFTDDLLVDFDLNKFVEYLELELTLAGEDSRLIPAVDKRVGESVVGELIGVVGTTPRAEG